MKAVVNKEKVMTFTKKAFTYAIIAGALVIGFFIGKRFPYNNHPVQDNPYSHAYDANEVSIAVNESNELLIVDRKTGKYIIYSDKIGMTIFKMYTNRIYQNATSDE
jgi:hypothetical protein